MIHFEQYKKLPLAVWILLFAMLINAISTMVVLFMSLYLVNALGLNVKESGEIVTSYGIGAVVGAYIAGKLSDIFSPLKISKVSLFLNAITIAFIIFFKQYEWLIVIIFFMGATNSAFSPVARHVLMQFGKPEELYLLNNLRYVMTNVGCSMIFIGGFLIKISYTVFFLFNSGVTLLACVLLFFIPPIVKKEIPVCAPLSEHKSRQLVYYFIMLNLMVFAVTLVFSQQRITYTIFLNQTYHMDSSWIGYLYLFATLFIVFCQLPLTSALRNANHFLICTIGGATICLGFFITGMGDMKWLAFLACGIWTLGEMIFYPTIQVIMYERAPLQSKGKYLGIYQAVYASGNIFGPYIGSRLYHFYNPHYVWWGCGLLALVVIALSKITTYLEQLRPN